MDRLFYTVQELVAAGVPRTTIRRLIQRGEIRAKKVGRSYHLHPDDVRRAFGFEEPDEPRPSQEALDFARELMA
jgi:excisionase family DNA binding protein